MANVFDYLSWRGDLTLDQDSFNAVDSLILTCLSYVHLNGIVGGAPLDKPVSLAQAAESFFALTNKEREERRRAPEDETLFRLLAKSPRFSSMSLVNAVNRVDEQEEKQFSALTVLTGDGCAYLAFRGTDNTLVGWKEDFNMSFLSSVPAQRDAAAYAMRFASGFSGGLRLGGHSKGGNLAVYAAAESPRAVQSRILGVFNNDGPGFSAGVLESEGYQAVRETLHTFVPQSSVVGMLLEHEENYTVVRSTQTGLMQHNPYSWEVLGPSFVCLESVTESSRLINQTLKTWLSEMNVSQREQFVDTLFQILNATHAQTLAELTADWLKNARIVIQALANVDEENRKMLYRTFTLLLEAAKQSLQQKRRESKALPEKAEPNEE